MIGEKKRRGECRRKRYTWCAEERRKVDGEVKERMKIWKVSVRCRAMIFSFDP